MTSHLKKQYQGARRPAVQKVFEKLHQKKPQRQKKDWKNYAQYYILFQNRKER